MDKPEFKVGDKIWVRYDRGPVVKRITSVTVMSYDLEDGNWVIKPEAFLTREDCLLAMKAEAEKRLAWIDEELGKEG